MNKTDENNANLFSKLEEQVALSILKGMSVTKCAHFYGLSKLKCQTIVNKYCFKSNRIVYDTLRRNQFEIVAPIAKLRKNVQLFIDSAEKNKKISLNSSIMALPDVPVRILNVLWKINITTVEELLRCTELDLKRLCNAGKVSRKKLIVALKKNGFYISSQPIVTE
jgi:NAD-dependent DNA ligase